MGAFVAYKPAIHAGYLPSHPYTDFDLVSTSRSLELEQLTKAYTDATTPILQIVAPYGAGKTSLIQTWLQQLAKQQWLHIDAVYGWIFGSDNTAYTYEAMFAEFVQHLAIWLELELPASASLLAKVDLLATAIQQKRLLLILDNIPNAFLLLNQTAEAFQQFIIQLGQQNSGLCLCASAEKIRLVSTQPIAFKTLVLPNLTPELGAQLLVSKGVQGSVEELTKVSQQFGNHAYALTLLGNYLREVWQGSINHLDTIPIWLDMHDDGRYTRRLLSALEHWLIQTQEMALIYFLCACDIPVTGESICKTLHQFLPFTLPFGNSRLSPLILPLRNIKLPRLAQIEQRLRNLDLLVLSDSGQLQVPAAVREYFQQKIESRVPDSWILVENLAEECQRMQFKQPATKPTSVTLTNTVTQARVVTAKSSTTDFDSSSAPKTHKNAGLNKSKSATQPIVAFGYTKYPDQIKQTIADETNSKPAAVNHTLAPEFSAEDIDKALDESLAELKALVEDNPSAASAESSTPTTNEQTLTHSLAELNALFSETDEDTNATVVSQAPGVEEPVPVVATLATPKTKKGVDKNQGDLPLTVELQTKALDEPVSFNPLVMSKLNYERAVLPNLQATLLNASDIDKQLEQAVATKNWYEASKLALNLYEQQLTVGNLPAAAHRIRQSVAYAHLSGNEAILTQHLTLLNDLLARTGEKPPMTPVNTVPNAKKREKSPLSSAHAA